LAGGLEAQCKRGRQLRLLPADRGSDSRNLFRERCRVRQIRSVEDQGPHPTGRQDLTGLTPCRHAADVGIAETAPDTQAAAGLTRPERSHGRLRRVWDASTGVIGVIVGLVPHLLHHVALLAGTALVVGSGGTALFAVVGVVASIPMLLRLRRRFQSWWAPAIGLGVFAVMFTISAFVIGPAISGVNDTGKPSPPGVEHVHSHS
jgi:hypothetical protein